MTVCEECGHEAANPVRIRYTTGATERLELCDSCLEEFEDGGFVVETTRKENG